METIRLFGRRIVPAMAVFAILFIGSPSPAQIGGPCAETIAKFCKDVVPGNGRLAKCLNEHRDDQSIACRDWMEDQQKSVQELMGVCAEDISRWCRNASPDRISMFFCLQDNYGSLRLDCRSKLAEIRDRLK